MLPVPEITKADIAFGSIDHMPRYDSIPDNFKQHSNPYAQAISDWFFNGASGNSNALILRGATYTPKQGVDGVKALAAIRAVLGSFKPKHEHKTAACAFMLSEWFTRSANEDDKSA